MFSRFKNFISRHRQKFIIGGIFVGGAFLLSKYVTRLIRELQEKETKEIFERAKKLQHYESIERTCNQTALTMAPGLRDAIIKIIHSEELVEKLRTGAPNKVLIWEELKILAFTKLSTLVYASSILVITLRIQLNVIGGYMFCDISRDAEENKITSVIQEKYLSLCQFFLEEGIVKLCSFIQEKVNLVLGDKSLREKLTIKDIEQIFWAIQTSISNDTSRDPCKSLSPYILPESLNKDTYGSSASIYDNIIVETHDLFECEEVNNLLQSCISCGFSHATDQIADFYRATNISRDANIVPTTSITPDVLISTKPSDEFFDLNSVVIPMAKIIPIINGLVQCQPTKDDVPHSWMQQLVLMDSLKSFGANIYETFSSSR